MSAGETFSDDLQEILGEFEKWQKERRLFEEYKRLMAILRGRTLYALDPERIRRDLMNDSMIELVESLTTLENRHREQ